MLFATNLSGTLTVSGAAAVSNSYRQVTIESFSSGITVEDNNSIGTVIPVGGSTVMPQVIDARGVTGAGVLIYDVNYADSVLHGSYQSDYVYALGSGADSLYGYGGDDTMFGYDGNDYLDGGNGNDSLSGGDGDDLMIGQAGNDVFDGGDGTDTIVYGGNRSEYEITVVNGQFQISHAGGSGAD
ncbi:calcium-binding protein, partial [Pseudooceanicola nanhaiensis]|uniref:calcium-binding protein n=1 Tax=Pseudooceanicola nanhaiensis TaxID=375761 RepID=UPI00399029D3|nr:hypothetical protein [Pseudooceanicola nanhaiensis]